MSRPTSDVCDEFGDRVRVLPPGLQDFGGVPCFAGPAATLRVHEDNALVRATLETPGHGRVLVVDGGGSLRTALVGGNLGALAAANGWAGLVVWGAVRDVAELRRCPVGVRALAPMPRRSAREGRGERDVPVAIGGVVVTPGDWVVADADGVVVSPGPPG
jgi:regulator of ribonuclease activity A